jgi:hypothetical protein
MIHEPENKIRPEWARQKINNRIAHSIGTEQHVKYRMGCTYLIDNSDDQMHLQQRLGVSDSRFRDFGKEFN